MEHLDITQTAIIVTIIGSLVQIIKKVPWIDAHNQWSPTISVVFGLVLGVVAGIYYSGETDLPKMVLQGIIYGLIASGGYSWSQQLAKMLGITLPSENVTQNNEVITQNEKK